jgi:hypothetical protein
VRTAGLLPLLLLSLAAACGGATVVMSDPVVAPKTPVGLIAVTSQGQTDLSARLEAVLSRHGYGLLDHQTTADLLRGLGFGSGEVLTPAALAELKARRIDAVLNVATTITKYVVAVDNVRVTATSTDDGRLLSSFLWTNAWGGMPGSPVDSLNRLSIEDAALAVAAALEKQLGPPGAKATLLDVRAAARAPVAAETPANVQTPAAKEWWK